jgi:hypothetical protein
MASLPAGTPYCCLSASLEVRPNANSSRRRAAIRLKLDCSCDTLPSLTKATTAYCTAGSLFISAFSSASVVMVRAAGPTCFFM